MHMFARRKNTKQKKNSSGVQLLCWGVSIMQLRTFVIYWKHSGEEIADVRAMTAELAIAYAAKALGFYETELSAW
jgi:hypothetical protein